MTQTYLTAPSLLAHVFLAAGSQDSPDEQKRLHTLWNDVTSRLGSGHPAAFLPVPPPIPLSPALCAGRAELVMATGRGEASSSWHATAWADSGILGLTVTMTVLPGEDCRNAWASLERTWVAAEAGHVAGGILGEARIFLALLAQPSGNGPAHDHLGREVADLVRAAVPEPAEAGWWQHSDAISLSSLSGSPGVALVWETGLASGAEPTVRRLATIATAESGHRPDPFRSAEGDGALTPLSRHLMDAARLRHQIRLFGEDSRPRQLRDELGQLVGVFSAGPAVDPGPARELLDRDQFSARLLPAHKAAIALRAELDMMRHVVGRVADNMRKALNLSASGTGTGPLSGDRNLATRFGQQLDDEITHMDATIRSAQLVWRSLTEKATTSRASLARPGDWVRASPDIFPPQRPGAGPLQGKVVVFTALGIEYEAIRDYLADPVRQHEERGTLYEVGVLAGPHGHWQVVLTQTGPGSTAAGVQLDRAVRVFAPQVALFLGIAGGRKDVARGDVVAADMIYDPEWGKSTAEGYQPRMRIHHPSHRLLQRAQMVARENRWQRRILPHCPEHPPASFVKPIVTSGKVVAHNKSEVALLIDRYADDALAVETEGHGFLEAAYLNPELDALVIRGISDLLVDKTKANDDYWQPIASRHAAAFAIEMLDSIGLSQVGR